MRFGTEVELIYSDLSASMLVHLNAKRALASWSVVFPNAISRISYLQKWRLKFKFWKSKSWETITLSLPATATDIQSKLGKYCKAKLGIGL